MQGGGYGYPPGGYGPPAGMAYPAQQVPQGPKPKSNIAIWIALAAVVLLALGGVAAAGVYLLVMAKPSPHLAKYMPKTTSLYLEAPSLKKSLVSSAKMKPLDSARVDDKKMIDDTVAAFASAFTMSRDGAREVVDGVDAMAFAARDMNNSGKAAGILSFKTAEAGERLLRSARFNDEGPYGGGGGKMYSLKRRASADRPTDPSMLDEALGELSMSGSSNLIVWFAKPKLLVFGDSPMVSDIDRVIAGGGSSLEENDSYMAAKKGFESGSDVVFFYDTHDLDDSSPGSLKTVDAWLHGREPVTGAVKIVKAGIMMDMHATLAGSSMPPSDLVAHPSKLAFPHAMPAETVAYMAMSTKTKMTSTAIQSFMLGRMSEIDPSVGKEAKDSLDAMQKSLGFSFTDTLDMIGDEVALGFMLDKGFTLDTSNGFTDEIGNLGLVYAIDVKDAAKGKMILGKIKTHLEGPDYTSYLTVRATGADAFEVDPKTTATVPIPNINVRFDGKRVIAVMANPALTVRTFEAIQNGKGTLGQDKGHELAFDALPSDANLYMWVDTGRITSLMSDGVSHIAKGASGTSLPLDAIRLKGDERVTSALAIRAAPKTSGWAVDVDSVNMPALSLFSIAEKLHLGSALPSGPVFE